jgi:NitT/TauT family transport system substrate-binding protein
MGTRFALPILTLAAAIVAISQAHAQGLKKVTVVHAVPQLSASFANESSLPTLLGFWKEEGLDVEVNTAPGTAAAMQLVISGQADIGVGNAHASMSARQKGAKVISYYTSLRGDIFGIAMPEAGNLKTLADLKGKVVGVSSFASGGTPYARGLLNSVGLVVDRDVTLAEVGVGGRAAAALQGGQVQALSLWDEMYARMNQNGLGLGKAIQDPRAKPLFVSNLVVRDDDLKTRQDVLVGIARGIAKAQVFSQANSEAAVRIRWKVYPQSAPREGITDKAVQDEVAILKVREPLYAKDILGTGRYGDIPAANVSAVQDYLVVTGQLEKKLDPAEYYDNTLIDRINDFDAGAIVARAKSFKLD